MPDEEDKRNAEAALTRMLPKIQTVEAATVETCNVPGTDIVAVATEYHANLKVDLPLITSTFTKTPTELINEFLDRALAAYGAEVRLETLFTTADTDRKRLYVEGGELKKTSVNVLAVVAPQDQEVLRVLDIIRPGTGYADRARDLAMLHPQLVRYMPDIVRRELMSEAQIDRIGELGVLHTSSATEPGPCS